MRRTSAAALKAPLGFEVTAGTDSTRQAWTASCANLPDRLSRGRRRFLLRGSRIAGERHELPRPGRRQSHDGGSSRLRDGAARSHSANHGREVQTNILFLDACRDNPLARTLPGPWARARPTSAAAGRRRIGHRHFDQLLNPARERRPRRHRGATHPLPMRSRSTSPATIASRLLIAVRNDVMRVTAKKQVPWEHSALTGTFEFGYPDSTAGCEAENSHA